MNKNLKQRLNQNDFINIVNRLLSNKEYRDYFADYEQNSRTYDQTISKGEDYE